MKNKMRYGNTSLDAILELERQRTDNYGEDYDDEDRYCYTEDDYIDSLED
jgi:hypothetical protein